VDISRAWEIIRDNTKASATESQSYFDLKQHKPWFDEECSKFLDERKQAKLQWLQYPSQRIGDNLNNVRREASKTFSNKRREYLKEKINELESNSENKNMRYMYRGINEFTKCHQPITNIIKDDNGDLLADSHNILNRWKNYFCQVVNVRGCIQKFPDWVDNEINNNNNKHSLRSNTKSYGDKTH
jgi:hypothetical protein